MTNILFGLQELNMAHGLVWIFNLIGKEDY